MTVARILTRTTVLAALVALAACGRAGETGEERRAGSTAELRAAEAAGPPVAAPAPAADVLPAAVAPFPSGLSGTLVFQSDREGRTKIYTIDLATGRVARLTHDQQYRDENPRWSPDGTRILFRSNRAHYGPGAESGDPDYDLYVMNADGSGVRRLTTDPANDNEGTWLPDGKSVVFSSDRDSRGDLYRVFVDDGRVERLTRHFVGRAIMPAVSPDGRQVAFAAQTLSRGTFWLYQVHLLDLATGGTRPLPGSGGSCWPAWAPGGGALAYVLLDAEPSGIERVDLGSGSRQALVRDAQLWSYYPDYSPDGRWMAFSVSPEHHEGEDWDLAVMASDRPGAFTRITTGAGDDRLPDWKP